MREIQLWVDENSLDNVFGEIDRLSNECKFNDCTHQHEPECEVKLAVQKGELNKARLVNYFKMKREIEIRLSKNYQVGAVNVREIEEGEWDTAKEFALSQAREIYSQLPSDSESKQVTKKQYKKVEKQEQNQSGNGDFPPLTKDYMGYGGKKQWDWYASEVEKVKDHPQFNPYELEKLQGDYENGFKLLSKALNYIKTH